MDAVFRHIDGKGNGDGRISRDEFSDHFRGNNDEVRDLIVCKFLKLCKVKINATDVGPAVGGFPHGCDGWFY